MSALDQQFQVCSIAAAATSKACSRSEEAIFKLRKEITSLRERFATRQKDWADVSLVLLGARQLSQFFFHSCSGT